MRVCLQTEVIKQRHMHRKGFPSASQLYLHQPISARVTICHRSQSGRAYESSAEAVDGPTSATLEVRATD